MAALGRHARRARPPRGGASGRRRGRLPQCDARPYTGPHNCFPVEVLSDGQVTISTAAGAYHPAYYFVIGSVGQLFEGAGVDYATRVVSGLLSAVGVACAAFCLVLAGGGRWTRFGFLTAMTPVFVYTSTLPAPNSMEIVAGLCLWTALIGFLRQGRSQQYTQIFLVVATIAACVLATVRMIGPMWLGLIVLTVLFWIGWTDVRVALSKHRWAVLAASAAVVMALASGVWWTLSADLVGPTEDRAEYGEIVEVDLGLQPVVWLLQIIAAFPLRADVAPPAVYVAYLLVVAALVIAGMRLSRGRSRLVLIATALLVACLPVGMTLATVETQGVIWQGRYGLPFAAGLTVLCGAALDRAGFAAREGVRLRAIGCAVLAVAHTIGIVHVLNGEHDDPVSVADEAWLAPHPALVVSLLVAGWVLWTVALARVDGPARLTESGRSNSDEVREPVDSSRA